MNSYLLGEASRHLFVKLCTPYNLEFLAYLNALNTVHLKWNICFILKAFVNSFITTIFK